MTPHEGRDHRSGGPSGPPTSPNCEESPDRARRPTPDESPRGVVTEARAGVTRSRPLNVTDARGQVQRLGSGGRGAPG